MDRITTGYMSLSIFMKPIISSRIGVYTTAQLVIAMLVPKHDATK